MCICVCVWGHYLLSSQVFFCTFLTREVAKHAGFQPCWECFPLFVLHCVLTLFARLCPHAVERADQEQQGVLVCVLCCMSFFLNARARHSALALRA